LLECRGGRQASWGGLAPFPVPPTDADEALEGGPSDSTSGAMAPPFASPAQTPDVAEQVDPFGGKRKF
jgi:hypothetical protein